MDELLRVPNLRSCKLAWKCVSTLKTPYHLILPKKVTSAAENRDSWTLAIEPGTILKSFSCATKSSVTFVCSLSELSDVCIVSVTIKRVNLDVLGESGEESHF